MRWNEERRCNRETGRKAIRHTLKNKIKKWQIKNKKIENRPMRRKKSIKIRKAQIKKMRIKNPKKMAKTKKNLKIFRNNFGFPTNLFISNLIFYSILNLTLSKNRLTSMIELRRKRNQMQKLLQLLLPPTHKALEKICKNTPLFY